MAICLAIIFCVLLPSAGAIEKPAKKGQSPIQAAFATACKTLPCDVVARRLTTGYKNIQFIVKNISVLVRRSIESGTQLLKTVKGAITGETARAKKAEEARIAAAEEVRETLPKKC